MLLIFLGVLVNALYDCGYGYGTEDYSLSLKSRPNHFTVV